MIKVFSMLAPSLWNRTEGAPERDAGQWSTILFRGSSLWDTAL